jgi:hypothetical protein
MGTRSLSLVGLPVLFSPSCSVLVHRYRDAQAEIRGLCAAAFGQLMLVHPQAFLADAYLKYLGWLLHDRDASVRDAALSSMQQVYGVLLVFRRCMCAQATFA